MLVTLLKSKIHRATVTHADLDYVGSITIDRDLMDAAGLLANEQVHVADIANGNRLVTYVIPGERGSGVIGMNGAAAHLIEVGDLVIVMAYAQVEPDDGLEMRPRVVHVDERNAITARGDDPATPAGRGTRRPPLAE